MREYKIEKNPYTLQFSYIPPQYINRRNVTEEIIGDLNRETPAFRCHFITGVRGSGKTVTMADIAKTISKKDEWMVVDIENPEGNILESLARGLYRNTKIKAKFIEAKLDVSALGIGVSIEKADLIATNEIDAMNYMLKILHKEKKKVLVTIDEATYCKEIAAFSHTLSSYARTGYEIYVLMTGLKENINAIKNDKSLTFLYRAKEHILEPLNITAIVADYVKVFSLDRDKAEEMAWMTMGYSFAFQVLGYLYWEKLSREGKADIDSVIDEFDSYLAEFAYDKIWSEVPRKEKTVLVAMASSNTSDVKDIRAIANMNSSEFSVYRDRLITRGLINGAEYGKVKFVLPRFGEYAGLQSRIM